MGSAGKGLESAVLQLKWTHQFQFAGSYMATGLVFGIIGLVSF